MTCTKIKPALRLDLAAVIGGPLDQHVAVVRAHLTTPPGTTAEGEGAAPVIPDAKKRSLVITLLDKLSEKVGMAEQQRGEAVERLASERNRCQVSLTLHGNFVDFNTSL